MTTHADETGNTSRVKVRVTAGSKSLLCTIQVTSSHSGICNLQYEATDLEVDTSTIASLESMIAIYSEGLKASKDKDQQVTRLCCRSRAFAKYVTRNTQSSTWVFLVTLM